MQAEGAEGKDGSASSEGGSDDGGAYPAVCIRRLKATTADPSCVFPF
jgi:hypothetical protein